MKLALNKYLQSVIQKGIRLSIKTYLGTDVEICEIRQVPRLQIRLGSLSTDWQHNLR